MAVTHTAEACPAANLPGVLLIRILQDVPQHDRLRSCALVCKDWAGAAALATSSVLACLRPEQVALLEQWLQRYGTQVEQLDMRQHRAPGQPDSKASTVVKLPAASMPKLTSLSVAGITPILQPAASSGGSSTIGKAVPAPVLLPKLADVVVHYRDLSSFSSLVQLTQLQSVTSLWLGQLGYSSKGAEFAQQLNSTVSTLLKHLPRLSAVTLNSMPITADGTAAASSILSKLSIQGARPHMDVPCLPRAMPQASALQGLSIRHASFYPHVLSAMTGLQTLELAECTLLPELPEPGTQGGAEALLSAIGQMRSLRSLEIIRPQSHTLLGELPPDLFTSLTASTQLTRLLVILEEGLLPRGALQHMFPPGKLLPHLAVLALGDDCDTISESHGDYWCMTAADLRSMITSCPRLQSLWLRHLLQPGDVTPLLQLPLSCCDLDLGGLAFDDAAAAVVAQLTHVVSLRWCCTLQLTDAGLDRLTALTRLEALWVDNAHGLSREVAPRGQDDGEHLTWFDFELESKPEFGPGPNVWCQLREMCERSPSLEPRRLVEQ